MFSAFAARDDGGARPQRHSMHFRCGLLVLAR